MLRSLVFTQTRNAFSKIVLKTTYTTTMEVSLVENNLSSYVSDPFGIHFIMMELKFSEIFTFREIESKKS